MMRETAGTGDFAYWEKQLTRIEAKILNGGREIPKEKVTSPVLAREVVKTTTTNEVIPQADSAEVEMYKKAYQQAIFLGEPLMVERFKGVLQKLGVEVKDEAA
jgi:hypothetical protein